MNTNIKSTNITLSAAITDYADKKIKKVSKMLDSDPASQCDIELARTTAHHHKGEIFKAEIHIVGAGKNLYAVAEREDLYTAIDAVRDDIIRELKNAREKRTAFIRRGGAKVKAMIKGLWPWR